MTKARIEQINEAEENLKNKLKKVAYDKANISALVEEDYTALMEEKRGQILEKYYNNPPKTTKNCRNYIT